MKKKKRKRKTVVYRKNLGNLARQSNLQWLVKVIESLSLYRIFWNFINTTDSTVTIILVKFEDSLKTYTELYKISLQMYIW